MPVEREIKFSLSAEAARRVARHVRVAAPWRRRIVSSTYYDTPDERLRRAGASLRLRRDGGRRLQTFKTDLTGHGGLATRGEWELPALRGRLDPGAFPRAEILAACGIDLERIGAKLEPMFETRFARRAAPVALDGASRAELCVDVGHVGARGRREPIRELEIELKSGAPRALLRYAERLSPALGLALDFESKAERGFRLAHGEAMAPPRKWRRPALAEHATPTEAFTAIAAAALAQAGANAQGFVRGRDPEYLHQLRVGLRRLRSAMRAFRGLADDGKALRRRLRKLMPALGEARDWDVFCDCLSGLARAEGATAALRSLLARARAKRAGARRRARQAAASPRFQQFLLRALRWLHEAPRARASPAQPSLAAFGGRALEKLHRNALAQARGMDWREAAARHVLRIHVKRLRYGCEFFAASFPRGAVAPYLQGLEALQDILGELNDVAVGARLLESLPPGSAAARVRRELAGRERRLIASLAPAWAAFERRPAFWKARR